MFYYIYILQSQKDRQFYTGYTSDLRKRIDEHNSGIVASTKFRRPFKLIYFEGCLSQKDALRREKYLKTSWGKRYVKNRLMNYLTGQAEASTTEISKEKQPRGLDANKDIARKGGNAAKKARLEIEKQTGKPIVTDINAENLLDKPNKKNIENL